jgi:hypothetical protein
VSNIPNRHRIHHCLFLAGLTIIHCLSIDKCIAQESAKITMLSTVVAGHPEIHREIHDGQLLVSESRAVTFYSIGKSYAVINVWSLDTGRRIAVYSGPRPAALAADGKSFFAMPEDSDENYKRFTQHDVLTGKVTNTFNLPFIERGSENAVGIHASKTGEIAIVCQKFLLRSKPVEVLFYSPDNSEGPIQTKPIAKNAVGVQIISAFDTKLAILTIQRNAKDLPISTISTLDFKSRKVLTDL